MTTAALVLALALGGAVAGIGGAARAAEEAPAPPAQDWRFDGIFGTFDRAAAQRGFQVYKEVCSTCHGMDLLAYRNLTAIGFNEDEVKAIAAQYTVTAGPDDSGEMFQRPGEPSDPFVAPFPNEQAARAANAGALPPDLSLIAQARPNGPDYVYAMLLGYEEPPPDVELMPGMYWNEYFPGHQIAMPDIVMDGGVEYTDGTQATKAQQAWDVTNFLMWAAEPHMEERKQMGVRVVLFLIVFSGMMYAVKRKVWSDIH
jgi:ubiquinol-cytochrome c reductase cytochrome c1 subunit